MRCGRPRAGFASPSPASSSAFPPLSLLPRPPGRAGEGAPRRTHPHESGAAAGGRSVVSVPTALRVRKSDGDRSGGGLRAGLEVRARERAGRSSRPRRGTRLRSSVRLLASTRREPRPFFAGGFVGGVKLPVGPRPQIRRDDPPSVRTAVSLWLSASHPLSGPCPRPDGPSFPHPGDIPDGSLALLRGLTERARLTFGRPLGGSVGLTRPVTPGLGPPFGT